MMVCKPLYFNDMTVHTHEKKYSKRRTGFRRFSREIFCFANFIVLSCTWKIIGSYLLCSMWLQVVDRGNYSDGTICPNIGNIIYSCCQYNPGVYAESYQDILTHTRIPDPYLHGQTLWCRRTADQPTPDKIPQWTSRQQCLCDEKSYKKPLQPLCSPSSQACQYPAITKKPRTTN